VNDGIRTHDRLDHNQELYQLSYVHHEYGSVTRSRSIANLRRHAPSRHAGAAGGNVRRDGRAPMRPTLAAGLTHELRFTVPVTKTVPHLYPESPEFAAMPEVFATGFMVGFVEWACIQAIAPHLDEGELSLGTHVDLSHVAATPPGMEVVARVRLDAVDGRRLRFSAEVDDALEAICTGHHERFVVDRSRFESGVARKAG
jgi:fluoroacetyl-CoA thioesterase